MNSVPAYWTIGLSSIAIAVSLLTLWRSERREIEKWRRDALLKLVSDTLTSSNRRQIRFVDDSNALLEGRSPARAPIESVASLKVQAGQYALLGDRPIRQSANAIVAAHELADRRADAYQPQEDYPGVLEAVIVHNLSELHQNLTMAFIRTTMRGPFKTRRAKRRHSSLDKP